MSQEAFLKALYGKDDIPEDLIELPEKYKNVRDKVRQAYREDLDIRPRAKQMSNNFLIQPLKREVPNLFGNPLEKRIRKGITRSLPSISSLPKCPEGYKWSIRSGKCIKDRVKAKKNKSSLSKATFQNSEILGILKKLK